MTRSIRHAGSLTRRAVGDDARPGRSLRAGGPDALHSLSTSTSMRAAPGLFAAMTGVIETGLAACLLLGLGRRAGYLAGAVNTLLIWAVGEGFGGPYTSGSTDVGTGIVYALLFTTLPAFAPPARRERLSPDKALVPRWPWWRFAAKPHAADRVRGAPLVEPVVVGQHQPGMQPDRQPRQHNT